MLEKEFFQFIYNRHLIWYKRFVLKEKSPWTQDPILAKYKIINMYRELDRCTLYILNKLEKIKDREQLLLNIIFYRFFNQSGLYEKLGIPVLKDLKDKNKIIKKLEKQENQPIFNNAYLISSGTKGKKKHVSILDNLEKLNINQLIDNLDYSKTPRESLEEIQKIPMVGPFLACEIWTDLSYFSFFKQKWTDNDFVNIGPGAKWGLEIIYDKKLDKKEQQAKLENLHKIQPQYLKDNWKKIAYRNSQNYPYLSITNIEGALCEFRKYHRLKQGLGKKRYFNPISYILNSSDKL